MRRQRTDVVCIIFAMIILLIIDLYSTKAYAKENEIIEDTVDIATIDKNYVYDIDDDNRWIIFNSYIGNDTEINVPAYVLIDGITYNVVLNGGIWKNNASITSICFEAGIQAISCKSMFSGCSELSMLDISGLDTSRVTDMFAMFENCQKITSLDLSSFDTSNVNDMGCMFRSCTNLHSVNLSNFNTSNVTNMRCMFKDCNELTSIDLSMFDTKKVVNMGHMFCGCSELITLDLSMFNTARVNEMDYMFQNCSNLKILDLSNFKFPNSHQYSRWFMFDKAFTKDALLVVPYSFIYYAATNYTLTNVSDIEIHMLNARFERLYNSDFYDEINRCNISVFYEISNDFSFRIDDSQIILTKFHGNNSSTSIVAIPAYCLYEGKKYHVALEGSVFENNKRITQVRIDDDVDILNSNSMFRGCTSLTEIKYGGEIVQIDAYMFYECSNLQSIGALLNKVTSIGDYAFYDCFQSVYYQKTLTLPSSLTSIGYAAFYNCYGIGTIKYAGIQLSNIGLNAFFSDKTVTTMVESADSTLKKYDWKGSNREIKRIVPKWIESYEYEIDDQNHIVTLEKYVGTEKEIIVESPINVDGETYNICLENTSFYNNEVLEKITISNDVIIYCTDEFFSGCVNLQNAMLPENTAIGKNMYYNCGSLEEISIGDGITVISEGAFFGCNSLRKITFSSGVYEIEKDGFRGCINLKSIELPHGLKYIGEQAFCDCCNLEKIIYDGTELVEIGARAFYTSKCIPTSILSKNKKLIDYDWYSSNRIPNVFVSEWIEDYEYSVDESNEIITLNKYIGSDTEVYISGIAYIDYKEFKVHINNKIFSDNVTLKTVEIDNSVIANSTDSLFKGCIKLKKASVPESFNVGNEMYYGCEELREISIGTRNTIIGMRAFFGCNQIMEIALPDKITEIGQEAFSGCESLSFESMPQNLKKIGAKAFFDCKGLGEIKFSDGITEIGQEAFSGCSDLVFECLPNKLRIIGAKAFYKCNALDFICYSGGDLSRVGEKAFYVNSNLKTHLLTDNKTLKSYDWTGSNRLITESDLSWCKDFAYSIYGKELTLTKYNGNSENLIIYPDAYIDGQVYKKISLNKAVFESNNVVKSVTIRNGVSLIDTTSMFDSCTELKKVVLPDDLSCIDAYMFHDCANLESVTIPDSIVSISDYAFYNCKKLNIGRLPSKLQVIGNVAFYNCNKISINKLPDSLKDIGKQAFYNCYAIKEITYNGAELSNVGEKAFYSSQNIDTTLASESEALSEYDWNGSKRTIKHLVSKWIKGYEYVVNESSNKIYLNKYIGSEKSCIIPKIAYWHYDEYKVCLNNTTFSGNEEVEKVVIEDGVEVCNTDQLFNDCTNLTEVTISSDSLIVGEKMFKNCEKLRTVLIYSSVDRICDNAFYGCANLRTISLPVGIKAIGSNAFYGCRNLEDISLPEKIVDIGVGAFSGCSKLTIDMLPRELKTIGESAFYECKSLTSVYYDGISLSKIGKNAFFVSEQTRTTLHTTNYSLQAYDWSSDNREVTVFEDEWYKDYAYTLGDSIIFLGKYIGTDKDVVVPPYVYIDGKQLRVHISKDTFKENERITSVNIMDGVYIDGLGSSEYSTISYTFYRCSNLRKVVLPSVVAGIGEYSFAYCRNLEQVKIPKTVKTIGVGAFYNCDKLSLINLNDEVFLIGEKAFEGCGSLALESLPKRIRTIGKKAFANCKKINISEMPEGLTRIGDGAFLQCDSISSIKLPSAITQIDDNAFVECENLTRIEYSGDSLESIGANVFYIASTSKIKTELVTNNRLLRSYNWNANNRRINNGTYNVSFYLPSNEYLADVTVEYDSPIYVDVVNSITFRVEEGYSIGSWYTITDGGEKKEWDIEKDIVTNDIRLYASLSPNRYWVSFDSNGGESNDRKLEVTYDAKYGELPNLENRDGLIFDGWFTSDIGGERITSDSLVNIAADHILYAHWKKEGQDENPSGRETCERCQSEMQKIVELAFPSPEQRPYQAYYKCKVCGDEWRVYYDFLPSKCIYVDPYISKNPTEKDYGQIEFDGYFCEPYIPLYVEFASVHLDHNSVDLNIGEKKTISAEIMPHHVPKDKLIWRSSDPSVVTVDSIGNITAISEGYATIKVTAGDTWDFGSAVCSINVVNSNDITTQESNDSNAGTDNLEANTTNGLKPNEVFKDSSGITYKASVDATKVSVIAVKNKKSINIDATVALKGKLYPVAEISAKAFAGKKIQNVTINAKNLRKVNKNAFKGTKKLKKVTIRGIKKDSKVAKQIEKAVKKANKKVKIVYK